MLFGRRENSYKTQHSKSQFRAFFPPTKQNVKKEILKGTDSNFSTKLNPNYQSNGKLFENENSLIRETSKTEIAFRNEMKNVPQYLAYSLARSI